MGKRDRLHGLLPAHGTEQPARVEVLYEFPENPLNFRPSTSIILKDAMKLVERFKRAVVLNIGEGPLVLYPLGAVLEGEGPD